MKLKLLLMFLSIFLLRGLYAQAQERNISGKVTSEEDGSTLPGVNVLIKGTTIGTVTDIDGNYRLDVPDEYSTLIFSFIGLAPQEVNIGNRAVIDVRMRSDVTELSEVLVTAIGIEKEERSIGYAASKVDSETLTKGQDRSVLNSLQGKVAGVNISSGSGAPGASTRVVLRGTSTLTGGNQPLYVVDGVPINNSRIGDDVLNELNGGVDFGNRANDINPEDVASVTVLKGASGVALYGTRAANGVIIITTKNGSSARGDKARITLNSAVTFDEPLKLPTYQNQFGQGFFGEPDLTENTSWGPAFDGKVRVWGRIVDDQQQYKPYIGLEDNVRDFFDVGKTYNNTLSIAGGNENSTYYLSYGNINADGFMPSDADSYKRHTLSLRGSNRIGKRFTSSASLNYVKKQNSFVPTGQDQSVLDNIMQIPRDISIVDLKDYNNKFNNLDNYYSSYTTNPYFVLNEHGNFNNEDRIYGNVQVGYDFADWLNITARLGGDVANAQLKQWRAIVDPKGSNDGVNEDAGRVSESRFFSREFNSDIILTFNKQVSEDFGLNVLLGHNINQRSSDQIKTEVIGLNNPGFYELSNSSSTPTIDQLNSLRRIIGAYSQVDLNFRNYVFLMLTARNDWSSTLPEENRSFFYPGANLSFSFTDALDLKSNILSFGKIRAGWAQTGRDADPYDIYNVFVNGNHRDGFRELTYPLPGDPRVSGLEVSNILGNLNLLPEISTEIEFGLDLRFFNDRLGIDATYYNRSTTDLIYPVNIPVTTGYTSKVINLGEIENKGIELLVRGTPLRTNDFSWDLSVNFTKNNNELISLNEDLQQASLGGLSTIGYFAVPGQPLGVFQGTVPQRDEEGNIVVNPNTGQPVAATEKEFLGNSQYDWMAGLTNQFSFKGFSLTTTFDIREGGLMFSRTASIMQFAGTAPVTTYNGRNPFIIPNSVVVAGEDDNGNPVYEPNTTPITYGTNLHTYWSNGGSELDRSFLVDKSFVKLRELALTYNLPKSIFGRLPFEEIQIGIIGRNLFIWTPDSNDYLDPEATTFSDDNEADYGEYQATPTSRSYGANLRITF